MTHNRNGKIIFPVGGNNLLLSEIDVLIPGKMSKPSSKMAGSVLGSCTAILHPRDPSTGEFIVNALSTLSGWSPK